MGALVLAMVLGCSGTQRVIRLDTGEGESLVHIPRTAETEPVNPAG